MAVHFKLILLICVTQTSFSNEFVYFLSMDMQPAENQQNQRTSA